MTPRDHALRVAVLEALKEAVAAEYEKSRADAEEVFAEHRRQGNPQQEVLLPDGTAIGKISIKAGAPKVVVDGEALNAYVREANPEAFEEYLIPGAAERLEVIALVKEEFPDLVAERIRPTVNAAYMKQILETRGFVGDVESGDGAVVAEVTPRPATGAFAFTGTKGGSVVRRQTIMAELQAGRLRDIAFGDILAIEPPEPVPAPAEPFSAPFCDEHGFLNPELAAAHAVLVQGGFSTPPREAYRMLRDGGVAAERARTWLEANGLNPADPSGEDAPWPLQQDSEAA